MMLLGAIDAAMLVAMLVAMAVCLVYRMETDARPRKGGGPPRAQDRRTDRNQVPQKRLWSPQEPQLYRKCKRLQSMLGLLHGEGLGHKQREQEREVRRLLRSGSMRCAAAGFQPGKLSHRRRCPPPLPRWPQQSRRSRRQRTARLPSPAAPRLLRPPPLLLQPPPRPPQPPPPWRSPLRPPPPPAAVWRTVLCLERPRAPPPRLSGRLAPGVVPLRKACR